MQAQRIKFARKLGIQDTLDFKVKHKDHNFYAEGIVVSNSHSTGYGYLTAICSYLKVNHTTEFFYSLLKNAQYESKPLEEIALISEELPYFNIELLQPHLLKSDIDFKIEGKGKIRMGLGNIKSISEKSLEKLRNFCHEYSSKFDVFHSANECGIGIGILQNLISAGTLNDYLFGQSRTKLVLEAALFNQLTPREKKRVLELGIEHNYDLIKIIQFLSKPQNGSDKPFIKEKRLNTLREDFKPYQKMYNINSKNEELCSYLKERELLGFSYSQDLNKILGKHYDNIVSIYEAKTELDGSRVTIGGNITELKSSKSKNGNKYIKIKLNDGKDSVDCLIFQHKFEENDQLNNNVKLEEGQLVAVNGSRKGEDAIFADKIVIQDCKIVSKLSDLPKEKDDKIS